MKRRGLVGAFAALLIAFGLSASAHAMDPDVPGQVFVDLLRDHRRVHQLFFLGRGSSMAAMLAELETISSG